MSKFRGVSLAVVVSLMSFQVSQAALIAFEAESGSLGTNIPAASDPAASGGEYIGITSTTTAPGAADAAFYSVNLPADTYDLYVRLYVGPQGGSDDSFFTPTGFGSPPTVTFNAVNQLGAFNAGFYTDADGQVIEGAQGNFNETYYWINISDPVNNVVGNGAALTTYTTAGGTETLVIAGREDGLRIDALALGTSGTGFSSAELNAALVPEPTSLVLLACAGAGFFLQRRVR